MVNFVSKRCERAGCKKQPSYGVPGGRHQFCAERKAEGMADLMNKRCEHEGCRKQPSYGQPGGQAQFCARPGGD